MTSTKTFTLLALGFALIVLGTTGPMLNVEPIIRTSVFFLGAIIIFLSVSVELMSYLQTSKRSDSDLVTISTNDGNLKELRQEFDYFRAHVLDNINNSLHASFTDSERAELKNNVMNSLSKDAVINITKHWEDKFALLSSNEKIHGVVSSYFEQMRRRLFSEVAALAKRANLNLVLGIMISTSGIIILGYFVYISFFDLNSGITPSELMIRFVIRFSLVVFIQLFAYFFLRLYRYSLFEIKYFQNELSNVEFKMIALLTSVANSDTALTKQICLDLAKSERNFVLKKGESTVSLRRDEMELNYEESLINRLDALKAAKVAKAS